MTSTLTSITALQDLAGKILASRTAILQDWRARVDQDPQIMASASMTRSQFYDHIPRILEIFCQELCEPSSKRGSPAHHERQTDLAQQHSQHRWQQGYNVCSLVREWGHLNGCIVEWLDAVEASEPALERARVLWAEAVNQHLSVGIVEHESLLQIEAAARLKNLENALEQVRQLEASRGEMLRQMSHDLRGGLTVVAGASSLLSNETMGAGDREQVISIMQGGVRSVSAMLSDLMDMSRLEAGHEKRVTAPFNAAQVLLELGESSQVLAEAKGLWLRCEGPESLVVEGDGAKIRRIAQNLLLNALKYTRKGGVTISWREVDEEQWQFSIRDTGPGLLGPGEAPIAREMAQATQHAQEVGASPNGEDPQGAEMMSADSKENSTPALREGNFQPLAGEGIGLSIVKRLCDLLHITIELETAPEKGSTFRLIVPRRYPTL